MSLKGLFVSCQGRNPLPLTSEVSEEDKAAASFPHSPLTEQPIK